MKRLPALLHPLMFSLASLLFLYAKAMVTVSPAQIIRPLIVFWTILALLIWPVFQFVRDWYWTGILLSLFVASMFFSSAFFAIIGIVLSGLLILGFAISHLLKRKAAVSHITSTLNVVSISAIVVLMFYLLPFFLEVPLEYYRPPLFQKKSLPAISSIVSSEVMPDIYYIVLDGYGRTDILQEYYDFDNSDFTEYLLSKGFLLPNYTHSNYSRTALSIASTLNMESIQEIAPGLDDSLFWWLMAPLIDHSRVREMLEEAGYTTISISTNWNITDNPSTDIYLHPYPVMLSDFEGHILGSTPLGMFRRLLSPFVSVPNMETHRRIIRYNFEALEEIPNIPGPKFVFAHIISPHPPFVFDQFGNPLNTGYGFRFADGSDFPGTREQYRLNYIAQVKFVNAQLKPVVAEILEHSDTPPIIILQADHGPGMFTDFDSPDQTCLRERFSIFAAYYLPGVDPGAIPSDLTPVNLYRIIFNKYFGTNMPLLENAYYSHHDAMHIYHRDDISSLVDSCAFATP